MHDRTPLSILRSQPRGTRICAKSRHWLPVDAATRRAEEAGQRRQGEESVPEEGPVALTALNVGKSAGPPLSMDMIRPVSDCRVDPLRFLLIYGKTSGRRMG